MTTLPADLEALLPEPTVRIGDYAGAPGEGASEDYFTADQMREAILAATERAAKIVLHHDTYGDPIFGWQEIFAAAIRARTGGGQT